MGLFKEAKLVDKIEGFIKNNTGLPIAYYIYFVPGEAVNQDIVFFNGLFSGASSWAYQRRLYTLFQGARLIFFDYRCQGNSAQVTEEFGWKDVINDVLALVRNLKLRSPIFIGHSLGAVIATTVSALMGDEIGLQAQILLNAGLKAPPTTASLFKAVSDRLCLATDLRNQGMERYVKDIFSDLIKVFFGSLYLDKLSGFEGILIDGYAMYNHNSKAVSRLIDAVNVASISSDGIYPLIKKMSIPTLLVNGDEDKIFPVIWAERLAEALPNSKLKIFEGVGHSCMVENHKEFNDLMSEFLKNYRLDNIRCAL